MYEATLMGNNWFQALPPRSRDSLLLHLCKEKFPGSPDLIFNLEMSADRISCRSGNHLHCIVPRGAYWLKSRSRVLLGVEALLLQGADIHELPTLRPRVWPNAFLQNLAGNAFNAAQFATWMVCCLALR